MNSTDMRAGIRKSLSHLRERYQRADDLVSACERHHLTEYLDLAYTVPPDLDRIDAAIKGTVERMEKGEQVIRQMTADGKDTSVVEDRWLTLMNCYMELVEAGFR